MPGQPLPSPAQPADRLNWRVILLAPLFLFAPWLATVLVMTWAGYPGVICVTPMAWLVALRLGLEVRAQSASAQPRQRQLAAALAGAWLGVLQGVLYWMNVPQMGPIQPGERASGHRAGVGHARLRRAGNSGAVRIHGVRVRTSPARCYLTVARSTRPA